MATSNGDVFVSDGYVNSRIVQFSKDGKFIRIIGGNKGSGPGQLQLPHGIAIDSKGRLLVADSDNKRIAIFDKDGKFIETWAAPCRGNLVITKDDTLYASDVIVRTGGHVFADLTTPGRTLSERELLLDGASTPPLRGGECYSLHLH